MKVIESDADLEPVVVRLPSTRAGSLILSSPHSGRRYTEHFLQQSRLPLHLLRRGEDVYVDLLAATGPDVGAPLIQATFPRVYCDVNRAPLDVDPKTIESGHSLKLQPSERGRAGLGSVPSIASGGLPLYGRKLPIEEMTARLRTCWYPYHATLNALIQQACSDFGGSLLLDLHSMPGELAGAADFVIGDAFGASAARFFVQELEDTLTRHGYRTVRNRPFSGGFITRHYGCPQQGVHVIQLEINRNLYLRKGVDDEWSIAPGFENLMAEVIGHMARVASEQIGIKDGAPSSEGVRQ